MGKVNEIVYKYLFTLITGIIIGCLIGVVLINALMSYRIDKYHEEIEHLKNDIEDKDIRVKKLEESINKWRMVLKDIKVNIEFEGNEIDKIELIKHIKEKYNILLGKEVKKIDIDMVEGIINNRIMKLDNEEYKIIVKKIILTDILELWIDTRLLE